MKTKRFRSARGEEMERHMKVCEEENEAAAESAAEEWDAG